MIKNLNNKKNNITATNTRNNAILATDEAFEARVDHAAVLTVRLAKKKAELDELLQRTREPMEAELAEAEKELAETLASCEVYALKHRERLLPKNKKSAKTLLATWSLKKAQAKLTAAKGETEAAALELVQKSFPECVRCTEALDKKLLGKLTEKELASVKLVLLPGVESFGVKPHDNCTGEEGA